MVELLMIQWGIVGAIVLLHFLLGFLRGTSKSLYFTIVSIFLTFVTLWIVSLFTIRWFFTPESLLVMIEGYVPGVIPVEFREYFLDPNLSGFVFAMVDLVLRIIGFFSLYPFIKGLLTLIIFKPIWKRIILKKLLIKQDEKITLKNEGKPVNQKNKKSKRLKKNVLSRFGGGLSGAVRGFVVAFIFLLPLIVFGGFITQLDDTVPVALSDGTQTLSTTEKLNTLIPTEFQGYLEQVYEMHHQGLGGIAQQITVNGKGIDRAIFDMIFTVDAVTDEKSTPINFGQEIESITGIAGVLVSRGYLDPGFDVQSIDKTNLDDFELIFSYIAQSQLLGYMIPTATRFGVENFLTEQIGINLYDKNNSKEALEAFESINWDEEFMRLYAIVEAALEFGSVAELMNYADNPALLAELSPEEGVKFANIIRAFSELRTLVLLNVAVDYALSSEDFQSQITWIEESEREAYLQQRFDFILSNTDFFIGETSDWATIAEMIEIIFSDEYGVIDLAALFAGDPEAFLNPDHADWIGALLSKFVEIELIMEVIPFGVDYGLYNALGDQLEAELAESISETLSEIDWADEFLNIGDIYKEITKLGIASAFGEDPDYFALVDDIAASNMDSLRTIVSRIFEDSQVVNAAIEIAAPIIIDTMIENESLRGIVQDALFSDPLSNELDFNFGYEINQFLTMIEIVNEFSSTSQLVGATGGSTVERLEFLSAFGRLPQSRFDDFTEAFSNLQILERVGQRGLTYIKETSGIEMLYVPTEVDIAGDINTIFGLIYYIAGYINDKETEFILLEDIDFTEMLEDPDFRAFLLSTPSNKHSELLFFNIAYNFKEGLTGVGLEEYLTIPDELMLEDIEDEVWEVEINSFIDTLFNLMVSIGKTDDLTLSIRGLTEASQDSSMLIGAALPAFFRLIGDNVDLDTGKDDFDRFLDSKIIYVSISSLLQGDLLTGFADQALSGVFGEGGGIDLSAPSTVIGVDGVHEDIEVGRITKQEIKKIFSSLEVLGITNPDDAAGLGLSIVTNLIDVDDPNDDFSVFLESDYLYVIIARLFSSEALGSFLGEALGGALGGGLDDVSMLPPVDAVGTTGVEEGLMTRVELRQLFVSFKLLNIEGALDGESIGINNILDLIEDDLLPGETDDFYLFLESKYIWDKISSLLLSDAVVSLIAADRYQTEDFVLPATATVTIGDKDRLTAEEIHNLFAGLKQLGVADFDSIDLDISTILSLTDDEIDSLLKSNYLYTVIDLTIKFEPSLTLPTGAFEPDGIFEGMIKKTEIKDVFKTLNILQITDLTTIDPESITIAQVNQVLTETDSFVVAYLISQAIIGAIGEDKIPVEAYLDGDVEQGVLSSLELASLMAALTILANGDETLPITQIALDEINVGNIEDLKGNDSFVIKQLVSDAIIDVIGLDNIPDEAFILSTNASSIVSLSTIPLEGEPSRRLTDDEIEAMIDAIVILANGDRTALVTGISTDVTIGQTKQLSLLPSFVIKQLVTTAIKDVIDPLNEGKIPVTAYVDSDSTKRLTDDEIAAMVDAIDILANGDDALLVANLSTEVKVGQLKLLKTNESLIIRRLLTDAIVDTIDPLDEGKIPIEAFEGNDSTQSLSSAEVIEMIDALVILANNDDDLLVTEISTDVKIGQLKQLKSNDSLIIKQLVSDAIVDTLSVDNTIPDEAHIDNDSTKRLTDIELNAMIDAIVILANDDDDLLVTEISTNVTIGQTNQLKTNSSIIIKQLISDAIVDALSATATIPNDAFIDSDPLNRLTDTEIGAMIDALDVLANGDETVLVSAIQTDITIGQLKGLNASTSLIIEKLISDQIIEAVGLASVPDDAYIDDTPGNNLKKTEIAAMIGVLEILAPTPVAPATKDDALVTSISTNVTVGQTQELKTSESVIIKQIITDSIVTMIGAANIPNDAYIGQDSNNRLTDTEIEKMIDAISILGDDDDLVTEVGTDVTIGQVKQLEASESLIITKLISDSIIEMLGASRIPNTAYIDNDDTKNLKPTEVSAMIGVLEELAPDPIAPATKDDTVVSTITINEGALTVATLKGFPDDSVILNRMISTALIDAFGATKVPVESYVVVADPLDPNYQKDILRTEINAVLEALELLGIETDGASSVGTNITFAQIDSVVAIGKDDLANYPLGYSPLIGHILSTPMVASVSDVRGGYDYGIPSTAYRNDNDLEYDEITKLISALKTIGNVGTGLGQNDPETTSIADVSIDPQSFGPTMLSALIAEDSLIVYRLISIGISDASIATVPSRAVSGDTNYDDDLPAVPAIYDIKIAEMNHIVASMVTLNISSIANVTSDITVAKLKDLNAAQIEQLVEADTNGPNTIIYYIISETVDSDNNVFDALVLLDPVTYPGLADDYYELDGLGDRIRLKRSSIALAVDAAA